MREGCQAQVFEILTHQLASFIARIPSRGKDSKGPINVIGSFKDVN